MPSKTLMIRKVVYEDLRKQKRRGESFSVLIERLLSRRHPLESLLGAWNPPARRRAGSRGRRRAGGGEGSRL